MADERELRNQVFTQQVPQTTAAEKVKSTFGLEIPTETVPLPSCGKTYGPGSPLEGVDTVDIKAMTAREEDILTNKALLKKGTVVSELIKSCLVDKSINATDLLAGDRNALMVAIRITGYGQEYEAELVCNECEFKYENKFNLSELEIRRLAIEPTAPGLNSFDFLLPMSKKRVQFKFLTGHDEEQLTMMGEKQKRLGLSNADSVVTTNLLYSILSIDGNTDRSQIASFVRMMPARDSLALRNYIKDNEPGIVMKQEATCPSCGHSEEVNMPIGVTFLWPGAK